MCGVAGQHYQFCFLHTHGHLHSRLYMDLWSQYSNYYYNNTQQNSVNPTCMGLDMCQIMEYSCLSDDTYTDMLSQVISVTAPLLGAVQLIRGVFHFHMSFISWFKVIRLFCCVCWRLYSWRSWSWTQGVRRYHNSWCTDVLRVPLNTSLRSPHFDDKTCFW